VKVLALDLSLTATGTCVDTPDGPLAERICYPRLRGWERIDAILLSILALLRDWRPDVVAVEGYSFGSKGRAVFDIAELGGVVRWELRRSDVPWVAVPPSSLKRYATGRGNATKDAMIAEAVRRFGFPGSDNNEADAWLLWHMAHDALAGDSPIRVPSAHRSALAGIDWGATHKE
jgi:Holliday junction resolvasome RuvABC endonuclease subunit